MVEGLEAWDGDSITSGEDIKKVTNGLDLLREYFFDLWD